MELQERLEELRAEGLGVAAISYDSEQVLSEFSRRRGITFPLLADAESVTITKFGILNTVAEEALNEGLDDPVLLGDARQHVSIGRPDEMFLGTPFPGTFIVDRDGRVTARFFEEFYRERNTMSSIMLRLGIGDSVVTGAELSTDHLQIRTYPSNAAITSGARFSLILDIALREDIHVYAPGTHDYRVIALTLAPQSFVRFLPVAYPESEIYVFEPLNERVPVYQKPFRLLQEVVLEATREAEAALRDKKELNLEGHLEYQACNDEICFAPVSVPLSWTLELLPIADD